MSASRRLSSLVAPLAMAFTVTASAQTWPARPITIVVPFGPGGSGDITARTFGRYLEAQVKQPVVVENKPGANGLIGTEAVKVARADGHTLVLATNSTHAAAPHLYRKVPYDPVADFEHVGLFGVFGSVALVPAQGTVKSLRDLVAFGKAHPGKVFFGHFNTSSQIPAELLKSTAGFEAEGVAYKSIGNAVTDLLGGQLTFIFADYVAAAGFVQSGKVVPIGVTESKRRAAWPEVPAIAETYPGYEVIAFLALAAPVNTPKEIVQRLNGYVRAAQVDPAFKEQMERLGLSLRPYTSDEYRAFVIAERDRWGQYVRAAKIEPQ